MKFQLRAACREARTLSTLLFGPTPIGATYFPGNFGYSDKRFSTSVSRMPLKGFKNKLPISSFLYCLTQARTRRVRSTFSSRWLTSATSIIFPLNFFFRRLRIEPEAAGWDASMLPVCYAAPQLNHFLFCFFSLATKATPFARRLRVEAAWGRFLMDSETLATRPVSCLQLFKCFSGLQEWPIKILTDGWKHGRFQTLRKKFWFA